VQRDAIKASSRWLRSGDVESDLDSYMVTQGGESKLLYERHVTAKSSWVRLDFSCYSVRHSCVLRISMEIREAKRLTTPIKRRKEKKRCMQDVLSTRCDLRGICSMHVLCLFSLLGGVFCLEARDVVLDNRIDPNMQGYANSRCVAISEKA
jgi:hypothetical protein